MAMPVEIENGAKKSFIVDGKHLVDDDVVPIQWHLGGRDCQKLAAQRTHYNTNTSAVLEDPWHHGNIKD